MTSLGSLRLSRDTAHKIKRRSLGPLYRRGWTRSVLCRLVSVAPEQRQWVFILGCYDSGTTLLWNLVTASRRCASLPIEGVFATSQLVSPDELGWTRMWWKVENEIHHAERDSSAELLKRDWSVGLNQSRRRPVFVEKSPSHALRIRWIDDNFNGPHFLYMVRNGYAVAEGIRRRAGKGRYPLPPGVDEYPIEWCARQWTRSSEVIEAALKDVEPGRVMFLKYENLCEEPLSVLEKAGRFLSLPDLKDQAASAIRNRNASSIRRLSDDDILRINAEAGAVLERYGYEVL